MTYRAGIAEHKLLLIVPLVLMAAPFLFFVLNFSEMKYANIILKQHLNSSRESSRRLLP